MADPGGASQALVRDAQARVAEASARRRAQKPHSAGDGVKQGVMSLLGGIGVGGAALVLGPFAGAQAAPKGKKVQGALKGAAGGLAIGITAPIAGAAMGVGKVVQGTKAGTKKNNKYEHIEAPGDASQDTIAENLARDREAYLRERAELYQGVVDDDAHMIGESSAHASAGSTSGSSDLAPPVDTEYYDVLRIPPTATPVEIRKAYHRRSLETHPDRTGSDGDEFKAISDAYQVLSDDDKRREYHLHGKTDSLGEDAIKPEVLFALMLMPKGFKPIVGDTAQAWMLASEMQPNEKGIPEPTPAMKEFHKQRVAELARLLVLRIAPYVEGSKEEFTEFAEREALLLSAEPLGVDVLHTVGYAYSSKAKLILGAQSSVPLRGFFASLADAGGVVKKQMNAALAVHAMQVEDRMQEVNATADDAERRRNITGLSATFLMSMVDVQNVLREVVEVVCTDKEQPPETLHRRAQAINALGAIFSAVE